MKNMDFIKKSTLIVLSIFLFSCGSQVNKTAVKNASNSPTLETNNYVLNATGQESIYSDDGVELFSLNQGDSLWGQDAHYLKGRKMAFQKNEDGTITDINTGLMWQAVPTSKGYDWQGAFDYCEDLNLGGYNDWRMPTAKELFSISDFSEGWPYLNSDLFSIINPNSIEKDEQYWSSNKYVGRTEIGQYNAAFGVNHATGHIKAYPAAKPKNGKNRMPPPPKRKEGAGKDDKRPMGNPLLKYVRAVRGEVYGINDFKISKDSTITDLATGLMWSQFDSQEALNWQNALMYAQESELANYTDWRLPNVKELQSIVDYSFAPEAKETAKVGPAINPLFDCTSIINENGDKDYAYYWTSTSARFQKGKPFYYAWYVAFGRAVNPNGIDSHGAGAVRFDTKVEGGPAGEGGERYFNFVRLVRGNSK